MVGIAADADHFRVKLLELCEVTLEGLRLLRATGGVVLRVEEHLGWWKKWQKEKSRRSIIGF